MKNLAKAFVCLTVTVAAGINSANAAEPGMREGERDYIYTDYQGTEYELTRLVNPERDILSQYPNPSISVSRMRKIQNPKERAYAYEIGFSEEKMKVRPLGEILLILKSQAKLFCFSEGLEFVEESVVMTGNFQSAGSGGLDSFFRTPVSTFFKKRRIVDILFNCRPVSR